MASRLGAAAGGRTERNGVFLHFDIKGGADPSRHLFISGRAAGGGRSAPQPVLARPPRGRGQRPPSSAPKGRCRPGGGARPLLIHCLDRASSAGQAPAPPLPPPPPPPFLLLSGVSLISAAGRAGPQGAGLGRLQGPGSAATGHLWGRRERAWEQRAGDGGLSGAQSGTGRARYPRSAWAPQEGPEWYEERAKDHHGQDGGGHGGRGRGRAGLGTDAGARLPQKGRFCAVEVGAGCGEQSSCPEPGDRKGLRAKQEKTKFPFPWFPGLVPGWGRTEGGARLPAPHLWFGLPSKPRFLTWDRYPLLSLALRSCSSPTFWAGRPGSLHGDPRVG
jgi:hypothetical protein